MTRSFSREGNNLVAMGRGKEEIGGAANCPVRNQGLTRNHG